MHVTVHMEQITVFCTAGSLIVKGELQRMNLKVDVGNARTFSFQSQSPT